MWLVVWELTNVQDSPTSLLKPGMVTYLDGTGTTKAAIGFGKEPAYPLGHLISAESEHAPSDEILTVGSEIQLHREA